MPHNPRNPPDPDLRAPPTTKTPQNEPDALPDPTTHAASRFLAQTQNQVPPEADPAAALQSATAAIRGRTPTAMTRAILPIAEDCYALTIAGRNPQEIAAHLSATRATELTEPLTPEQVELAVKAVSLERQRTLDQSIGHHFTLDLQRIEALIGAAWTKAVSGDNSAISTVTNLLRRKASQLGLDSPEVRIQLKASAEAGPDLSRLTREELLQYRTLLQKITLDREQPEPKTVRDVQQEIIDGEFDPK